MRSIVLCGPPASGKTTVARRVAEILGWDYLDTDLLIEKELGKTCREIALDEGEEAFRAKEMILVRQSLGRNQSVIALGGGVLQLPHIDSSPYVIYLRAPFHVLWQRKQSLPFYANSQEQFEQIIEKREPYYKKMADIIIENAHNCPETVAEEIVRKYGIK